MWLVALWLTLFSPAGEGPQGTEGGAAMIRVTLTDEGPLPGGGHRLAFEVRNAGEAPARLCAYQTPFEGFLADLLDVRDAQGKRASYLGMSVKRGAPGESDHYVLAPGEARVERFNLAEQYRLPASGAFTVQFKGNAALNALPDSNVLTLTRP